MTSLKSLKDLDQFPPCLCRAVARNKSGRKPLSCAEIARRSGLHRITVIRISKLTSWSTLSHGTVVRFSEACGVNLLHPYSHIEYLKRRKKIAFGPQHVRLLTRLRAVASMPQSGFATNQPPCVTAERQ